MADYTLATNVPTPERPGTLTPYKVKASAVLPKGTLVGRSSGGFADVPANTAGLSILGVADEDITGGASDGLVTGRILSGVQKVFTLTSVADGDVGKMAFLSDNHTVTLTKGAGVKVGRVVGVYGTNLAWIQLPTGPGPLGETTDTTFGANEVVVLDNSL